MRCASCGLPVFDGDTGWYSQHPVTSPDAPGLIFMDRLTACPDGSTHQPDAGDCDGDA